MRLPGVSQAAMPPTYAGAVSQSVQHGNGNGSAQQKMPLTPTAMSRWSVSSKQLPPVDQIKSLHVYDFDNTCEPPADSSLPLTLPITGILLC